MFAEISHFFVRVFFFAQVSATMLPLNENLIVRDKRNCQQLVSVRSDSLEAVGSHVQRRQ